MKTKFSVLVDYTNGKRTVSCRKDIDRHSSFKRLDDNSHVIFYKDDGTVERLFTVIYEGEETDAKQFAIALNMLYDSKRVPKLGMRMQEFIS